MTNRDAYWQTAATVCTDKQFHAIVLRDISHCGTRFIALHLGISRSAVRERLNAADRKIADAIRKETE